jgi:lysophospholipase L1-like esterase
MLAVAVTVGTFAATVGAQPVFSGKAGELADSGPPPTLPRTTPRTTPTTSASGGATTTTPPQPLKVLVVGDSQGATLAQGPGVEGGNHGIAAQPGVLAWDRAILACSITTQQTFVIKGETFHNKCGGDQTWQQQWTSDVAVFKPDVVVVAAGAWDIYDVELADGRVVGPGDPTWSQDYEADVVNLFDILHAGGAPVIGVIPSCYGENTYPGGDGPPAERRDIGRIRAVRQAWDAAADITGGTIAPLDDVLCPGGTADSSIRPDGAHYDGAGADRVAPAVIATARRALARSEALAQSSERTPRNPNQASSATHAAS